MDSSNRNTEKDFDSRTRGRGKGKEETRRQVETAALSLFSRLGFGRATIDRIATVAGVAKGTVLWHFGTKGRLFDHVARSSNAKLLDDLDRQRQGDRASALVVARQWLEYFATDSDTAALLRSLCGLGGGPEHNHLATELNERWVSYLVARVGGGKDDPGAGVREERAEWARLLIATGASLARTAEDNPADKAALSKKSAKLAALLEQPG